MSLQKSKISLSFLPKTKGETVLTLDANSGSKFFCEQIKADFVDHDISVSLSGTFEGGARVKGILRNNTESRISILKYLGTELCERDRISAQENFKKAISLVEEELQAATKHSEDLKESIKHVLKVYAEDFDWTRDFSNSNLLSNRNPQQRESIRKSLRMFPKKHSRSLFYELPYSSISSFLSVETYNEKKTKVSKTVKALSDRLKFDTEDLYLGKMSGRDYLIGDLDIIDEVDLSDVVCFFRIKTDLGNWADFEGTIVKDDSVSKISLALPNFHSGNYEVTAYLKSFYTNEIIWKHQAGRNYHFTFINKNQNSLKREIKDYGNFSKFSFVSFDSFGKWCSRNSEKPGFGKYFLRCLNDLNTESKEIVFGFYTEALKKISKRKSVKASSILKSFRLLGASNILMISPEGPHAMAGGLSQVISGLSAALIEEGCFITVVTPLYNQGNGNHHSGIDDLLLNGLEIFGEIVPLRKSRPFYLEWPKGVGPHKTNRLVQVYEASIGSLRFLFVNNPQFSDVLYGGVAGIDSVERSVFLSRAALKIVADQSFECHPDVIITHDWTTALVRPIQKLANEDHPDSTSTIPVIHMLHNAGEGYQGRFKNGEGTDEIWDIIGLGLEHFAGFSEANAVSPQENEILNLSKAACFHNDHGIVTVSRPYAQSLLSENETSTFSEVLRAKHDILYGISNGIPTQSVRSAAFKKNHKISKKELSFEEIIELKAQKKLEIQARYGVEVSKNAILAVLVGRLTDQKGLSLLSELVAENTTVLEAMLLNNENVQIIIAGPPSIGDKSFTDFNNLISGLRPKFSEKCKVRLEFIPHSEALELTAGADLFLMPSKYEPGGIAQLEALAVGTSVVAHRVGGLSTTLVQFQRKGRRTSGNSFLFDSFSGQQFLNSFELACRYMSNTKDREKIIFDAYNSKNDWRDRVPYYLSLFQKAVGLKNILRDDSAKYWESREELLSRVSTTKPIKSTS